LIGMNPMEEIFPGEKIIHHIMF